MIAVSFGLAQRPCRGQTVSGDEARVIERGPLYMLAMADGLGHGPQAREAATAFCTAIAAADATHGLEQLLRAGDRALVATRGAAAAIVAIDRAAATLSFTGIGNIELQAASVAAIKPVSVPGVVGKRVRTIKVFQYDVQAGDLFTVYTDGVSSRLSFASYVTPPPLADRTQAVASPPTSLHPQALADRLLREHGKETDDATCAVLCLAAA